MYLILHKEVNINPPLENQRHSSTNLNCAVDVVLELLQSRKEGVRNNKRIKAIMKINETYYKTGALAIH